jgi:hypothetical protein
MLTNLLEKALLISSDIHTHLLSIFCAGKPEGFFLDPPECSFLPHRSSFGKKINECGPLQRFPSKEIPSPEILRRRKSFDKMRVLWRNRKKIKGAIKFFYIRFFRRRLPVAAQGEENPPVITDVFASNELAPGDTWTIFLRAQAPDGGMKRVICTLEQPGAAQAISFVKIRKGRQALLSGYIFLNTEIAPGAPFASCRLSLQIQDEKGNFSNPVSLRLSLNPRAIRQSPPAGVFEDENLGPIQIRFPAPPGP